MPIEVNGKTLETDEEGYLANINEWEPGVAEVMAKQLSAAQWQEVTAVYPGMAYTPEWRNQPAISLGVI